MEKGRRYAHLLSFVICVTLANHEAFLNMLLSVVFSVFYKMFCIRLRSFTEGNIRIEDVVVMDRSVASDGSRVISIVVDPVVPAEVLGENENGSRREIEQSVASASAQFVMKKVSNDRVMAGSRVD